MSLRWVLAASAVAVATIGVAVGLVVQFVVTQSQMMTLDVSQYSEADLAELSRWYDFSSRLLSNVPGFASAGLIALAAAVALLARWQFLRQRAASASATASASAATSASATASRDA